MTRLAVFAAVPDEQVVVGCSHRTPPRERI
jgi:hypothetical protein